MKNKAFTLVELLAVIMILGLLMLIAIPSVSNYIKSSRDNTYISSLKNFINAARELVETEKISIVDKTTTYYIPKTCLKIDNEESSPYGEWEDLYVAVTYDGVSREYYVTASDSTKHGVELCKESELEISKIKNNFGSVDNTSLLGNTKNIYILNPNCTNGRIISEEDIEDEMHDGEAVFDNGSTVNLKMKKLAGDYTNTSESTNYNIKYIKRSKEEPTEEHKTADNIVSALNSAQPIYMWFEEPTGTIYWWSEDRKPSFGASGNSFFSRLDALIEIEDLHKWDTKNLTNMSAMFRECTNLISLDLSNFDTSNVTAFFATFNRDKSLITLDLSSFDTSNATDMHAMFSECESLESIDISTLDTSKVFRISSMFSGCFSLKSIDLSHFNTSKVTEMNSMFSSCKSLTELDLSNFDTSKAKSLSHMFTWCENLVSLDLSSFNTINVKDMKYMFYHCGITSVDLSSFNTSNLENMEYMFCGTNLTSLDLSSFTTIRVTNMNGTFYSNTDLTNLDISNFNTSNVTNMHYMFSCDYGLTSLDLSHFDTSNVTNMSSMFSHCSNLEFINLSSFNTSNVTDMNFMFYNCKNLVSLDISSFDSSNITNARYLFYTCKKLETIYTSESFNLTSLQSNNADNMFTDCLVLRGGSGTVWDSTMNYSLAKVDGGPSNKGLFTKKTV